MSAFVRTILGLAAIKIAFGGLVFVTFPEGAAGKPFPDAVFALLMLAFGAAMILIMLWRPKGLSGARQPTVRLKRARLVTPATVPAE